MLGIISDMMTTAVFFDKGGRKSYGEFDAARRRQRANEDAIRAERHKTNPLLDMPSPFLDLRPRGER